MLCEIMSGILGDWRWLEVLKQFILISVEALQAEVIPLPEAQVPQAQWSTDKSFVFSSKAILVKQSYLGMHCRLSGCCMWSPIGMLHTASVQCPWKI